MATKSNQYTPDMVSHPGETLREKLEELKMGPKQFAVRTGKPEKTISLILGGESAITPDMAVLFENVLKIPASFWIRRQNLYNESMARIKRKEAIEEAVPWAKSFPYAAMANKGWVPKTLKVQEKVLNLFTFFGVATYKAWESYYLEAKLKIEFRISLAHTNNPYAISAWLRHGEIAANEIDTVPYSKAKLEKVLPALRNIMAHQAPQFFAEIQETCASAGVKVVYSPGLPKAPISGATRWLGDVPLVQLTGRYKRNDSFWFTFFHELGHILKHGKKYISLEKVNYEDKDATKEAEADDFAVEWTFSETQEAEVLKNEALDTDMIIAYAKQFNTHPAMIIGRLQRKQMIAYSEGRELIKKIDLSELK